MKYEQKLIYLSGRLLKERKTFLFPLSAGWNVDEMAGAPISILDHKVTWERIEFMHSGAT